ncbi:pyruvate kinase [Methanocaldococcus vulcanius M7]|uniref:Pyruvate kinase n=1 Tax=Methanocaldococcus vulcanius (strain ATCC 700851 / DSM 12094 / M7) TaxID=579137 RepID=C9RHB2_METVM|nr:pyruvate kinase [Methanocaldococcus vulcanius]ACX72964.1 pyruvate kinase [Methanocaldococcus vulcanius M7]
MRKTKILITLGPSIEDKLDKVIDLIDGVRFNMSHATTDYCNRFLNTLEKNNISKVMDLKGIKIRIKKVNLKNNILKKGEKVIIGKDIILNYDIKTIEKGHFILINDGKIKLKVLEKKDDDIVAVVEIGGEIKEGMGVNLPDTEIDLPIIDEEDMKNIKFAVENEFEYIALSFVRDKNDVKELKNIIKQLGGGCEVISKIETKKGLKNVKEIAKESDGLMVARGDLGVEIPIENIPIEQKNILRVANKCGILSITATQILDSMVYNPFPTRAEVTDIANAIYDGTDCLMLSNETTIGKYPVEAIKVLNKVAKVADEHYNEFGDRTCLDVESIDEGLVYAVYELYKKLNTDLVITPTYSGRTAKLISKLRIDNRIIAPTPNLSTLRKLRLVWGVESCLIDEFEDMESVINACREIAKKEIGKGIYLITLGHPIGHKKTNTIKVERI